MVRSVECTGIRILNLSELIDDTADKTANNTHQLSTKLPTRVRKIALLKRTSDLQKTTSWQDRETTLHHSDTQNTETLQHSANISGLLKTITLTTLFHSVSSSSHYNSASKRCNLSLKEKLTIISRPEFSSLKKRYELLSNQYQYLGNCPPTPPLTQQQSVDNNLGLMLG